MTVAIVLVLMGVVLLFCLIALIGQLNLLTREVAQVAIWTRESVNIGERNARTSERMADAICAPPRVVEHVHPSPVTAVTVPVDPNARKH